MHKKWIILLVAIVLTALTFGTFSVASAAGSQPGDSPDNPIVVTSLDQIPAEAALAAVKNDDCSTTTTAVLTVPGSEETTHQEFRFLREVPAVDEVSHNEWGTQERTRTYNPGQNEVSHTEYKYQRTVQDYKTQYHFRKYTHTKTGTKHGNVITYGAYGPWTPWEPMTHESWEDSNTPLGVPEYHGDGHDGNTYWYREWQAQADGQTRQVANGSHTETSDWLTEPPAGDGWVQSDNRQVVDQEAIPASYGEWTEWETTASGLLVEPVQPENTDTHEYRTTGPVKVVDSEYVAGYTEYYVLGGEPSLNEADASWILAEQAPEGWTQFDERTVENNDGTDPVTTYYSYNDGVKCTTPPPPHHNPPVNPPAPAVPTVVDAGL